MCYRSFWTITLCLLLVGWQEAWADDDRMEARRLVDAGKILPLEQILNRIGGPPMRVLEVELEGEGEHYVYEIELLEANGRVVELVVDAQNGRVLSKQRGD